MSFFDSGMSGDIGPFLQWSAKGTMDGEVDPRSWFIRTAEGKEMTDALTQGVVLDIQSLKTGWQYTEGVAGVAPEWQWGESPSKLPPRPSKDWKTGLSIRVALPGGAGVVTWEQAGAAAWNAFGDLVSQLEAGPITDSGKAPIVRMTGSRVEKFAKGSTVIPVLEVVKWIEKPASLAASSSIDTGEAATQAAQPKTKPAPQPAEEPADVDALTF